MVFLATKYWREIVVIVTVIIIAYGSVLIFGKNNPIEIEMEKTIDSESELDF